MKKNLRDKPIRRWMLALAVTGGIAAVACSASARSTLAHFVSHSIAAKPKSTTEVSVHTAEPARKVLRTDYDALELAAEVMEKMRLQTAVARPVADGIALPSFQGVLALDNDRLSRVHSRFAGEVVEIADSPASPAQKLRVGDRVQQGQLLAVAWSTELGQRKSALVDALSQLRAEQDLRDRMKKLFEEGAGSGRSYRDAEKVVEARLVEISAIERSLRIWRVSEEDLQQIRLEAEQLARQGKVGAESKDWAKVEIRAPMSGIVLEKNINVGDLVDTSNDLFKIGELSSLAVWAHVYEEDLSLLEALPRPIEWTVTIPSRPGVSFLGTLDKIGSVIDASQHTALIYGRVDNALGDLRVGQFVSVSINLPAAPDEVQLPATAVVEDGKNSHVFVRLSEGDGQFVRRPVHVVRRLGDWVYVRAGSEGFLAGQQVVTSGALMLQNAIDQLPIVSRVTGREHAATATLDSPGADGDSSSTNTLKWR